MVRSKSALMAWFLLSFFVVGRAGACVGVNVSTQTLDFTRYEPLSGQPAQAEVELEVECFFLLPINVVSSLLTLSLDGGISGNRQMTREGGGASLAYGVFRDAARLQTWGSGEGSTISNLFSFVLGSLSSIRRITGFASIPAGQDVPAGIYSDSLTVTVEF